MFEGTPQDWVGAWSEKRAALTPDRVAVVDSTIEERYTYADLEGRANRTARLLSRRGVTDGERVAVVSRNRPAVFDLFFATAETGSVLAPLSHRLAPPELAAMLDVVDPTLLVVESPFREAVRSALDRGETTADPEVLVVAARNDDVVHGERYAEALPDDESPVETATLAPGDPHLFLHTGGSTGLPKATVLSHRSILWNSVNTITSWGLRDDDVTPLTFPTFHTGGWNVLTVPLIHMGGRIVIDREVDPGRILETIEREGATVLVAVPAVLRAMTEHGEWTATDLSTLRFVKSGGGPCRQAVMETWWDRGVDLSQGYGLTECGPNTFAMPDGWPRERADAVGKPVFHEDVRIVDEDGDEVPTGEVGELRLRGPHAADGYWDDPEATTETFGVGGDEMESTDREWVATGDLATVDEEGYYRIVGRKKDMFVSGGENVYPAEVEDVLADHPEVVDVVVVPVPDEEWGEVGKAVAVAETTSLSLEGLREFCDGRLARYKHPRYLVLVDELPRSGPDKIDRRAVRERFGEAE